MSQPVNLSNFSYSRLKEFKEKHRYKSFSDAVNALIKSYWSPVTSEILLVEKIEELRTWLEVRGLNTEGVDEATDRVSMRARKAIADKKKAKKLDSFREGKTGDLQ